jgi:MoaD family protein
MENERMPCEVRIPAPLRPFTGGKSRIELKEGTVRSLLQELGEGHEGVLDRICASGGELRSSVNIYVNDRDIKALSGLDTSVADGDEILIVPAIAGG